MTVTIIGYSIIFLLLWAYMTFASGLGSWWRDIYNGFILALGVMFLLTLLTTAVVFIAHGLWTVAEGMLS